MAIRAEMADGTVLEFPDGTSDTIINRAAQEYIATAPVQQVDVPASESPQSPMNAMGGIPDTMANRLVAGGRSAIDAASMNFADEAYAALMSGAISGPEYERILAEEQAVRRQEEEAFPGSRAAGMIAGSLATMAIPGGALMQTASRARQAAIAAGTGAGMTALSGAGAAQPGRRTENLAADAILGGAVGAASVPAAALARRAIQAIPGEWTRVAQTSADDVLQGADLDVDALRAAAADFQARTGRGARLADILSPEQASRLTNALGRSPAVRERITGELEGTLRDLPERLARRAGEGGEVASVAEETARLRQIDRANYGAVEDTVVPLPEVDRAVLERDILPYISLPKATRDRVMERFDKNQLTGLDLQNLRQSLTRFSGQIEKSGRAYDDLIAELDAIVEPALPELGAARAASAAQRSRIEGVEIGQRAGTPSNRAMEVIGEVETATPLQQEGIAGGTRGALVNQAFRNPSQSYSLARQLDENPGFQAQVRAVLPAEEADAIIADAVQNRRAIDGLAALARIQPDKIQDALNNTDQMLDWGSFLTGGAGAAFRANLGEQIARFAGVGRAAAEKLAEDLLNSNRRDRVLEMLEKSTQGRFGAREAVQSTIISTANQFFTGDRALSGVPQEMETPQ
jgi:hypothetical protein